MERIVQSLTLPFTAREQRALKHDVPASALADQFYLRCNQREVVAGEGDLRRTCSWLGIFTSVRSRLDPKYAPAWACLGRTLRFLGQVRRGRPGPRTSRAPRRPFRKAFALNPELALAHHFYTALQTDLGRSLDAMERLLTRAHTHHNDVNLLAALVQACRYCDLLGGLRRCSQSGDEGSIR